MLPQSSSSAGGLISCHLLPKCRPNAIRVTFPSRGVFARSQNTASNNGRRNHIRSRSKRRNEHQRIELDVTALGKPGEVVVLRERNRRRFPRASRRPPKTDKSALTFMLNEIEQGTAHFDSSVVTERIEGFRLPHQPQAQLTPTDWEDLRSRLRSSFTIQQLSEYISKNLENKHTISETSLNNERSNLPKWRPGISDFLETSPISDKTVADRVAISQDLQGKDLLVERIIRDCWQLGINNEIGQLDIRLPAHFLSLLLSSQHFSFEELASLHEVKIDVTHSLGLVRVTGKQRSCESIGEIIYDTSNRIRQEDIHLLPPGDASAKALGRILSPEFMSWVGKTYGVSFEQSSSHLPDRIFYLLENKVDAQNVQRTLNLALNGAASPPIPFSTYMSASQLSEIQDVYPENSVSWPDRGKSWFRWEKPTTQDKFRSLPVSFFLKHNSSLSDELLKVLREPRPVSANFGSIPEVHESVTAAVGKCLFLRKPFLKEKQVSASQLGKMSLPRTFTSDVPRAAHLLRMLTPHVTEEGVRSHRIRLVPSALHADIFPHLEVELAVTAAGNLDKAEDECVIRSAKAILAEKSVDYLLPEAMSDVRFTRKLAYELLPEPQELCYLGDLHANLQNCFTKSMTSYSEVPLPISTPVTLPAHLLRKAGDQIDLSGRATADYMFQPVKDIHSTRVHQYDFRGQRLFYASYESGPFHPHTTTDLFLQMDLNVNSLTNTDTSQHLSPTRPFQEGFHSFYNAACALAFELYQV